jgi:hypothetical protein
MSEAYADAPPQQGPGFMQQRYMGIPAVVWLAAAAAVAYFLFFRNSGGGLGGTSTGGGGTSSTGDITLQPGTETIDLQGTTAATGTGITDISPQAPQTNIVDGPMTPPQPQPTPVPPPKKKSTHYALVTVAKWPGKTSHGLAQWNTTLWGIANHYHTSVAMLLKLNPSIKNPNIIYPGQKIKVPTGK